MANNTLRITTQISATDNNVSNSHCALIWHRIVGENIPNGGTQWVFDTNDFITNPIKNITDDLINTTLLDCGGLKVEVLIIPCCSTDINCSDCSSVPPQPYPTTIPDTAYHNYLDISDVDLGNAVKTYGFKRYNIPSTTLESYDYITVTGNSGCILLSDSICSGVSINVPSILTVGTKLDLNIYGDGLVITGYVGSTPTVLTANEYRYNETYCWFNTYLYQIVNNDNTSTTIWYQDSTGQMQSQVISAGSTVYICAKEGTPFTNGNITITAMSRCL